MATVETARGAIDTGDLGRVLMHEHVFVLSPEIMQNYPEEWGDEEVRVADAVRRLSELKAAGIDSILDPTALGLGRYIPRIAGIASRIELNILVATGLYTFDNLPHYFNRRTPGSGPGGSDPMVDMFVRDITEGIADTGIKAAVLKCATDRPGVTPGVERVLRAVAQAHRATGAPITTHTQAATHRGLEQQKIFTEEGVDLSRVVIGHSGDTDDLGYLEELIANGSLLGMTASASTACSAPRSGSASSPSCAAAATQTAWCSATTRPAISTGSPASCRSGRCRTGTTSTSAGTCSPPCGRRV